MLSLEQLVSRFHPDSDRPYQVLVGFELEVLLFDRALSPASAEALGEVFEWAAGELDGEPHPGSPPRKMDLPDGALISLEPGGQFEFASPPVANFGGCLAQLDRFLGLLDEIEERFALRAFFGGANPIHSAEEIGLVISSDRYRMMDAYLARSGTMGRRMMRQSASFQITFDYRDAPLGTRLLQAAQFVAPIVAALLAHSPYAAGRRTEHRSQRVPIWDNTDPARCGVLPGFSAPDYGFEDYVAHVIQAPMIFVEGEGGELLDAGGITFDRFNREGGFGRQATLGDFWRHNSTIFTDVRLKQTVEVRTVDCQDPALIPGALALLCGLLLCERAREDTLGLLSGVAVERYHTLGDRLSREGLRTTLAGKPTVEVLQYMIDLARNGLSNCFEDGGLAGEQLDPLVDLVDQRKTPADLVLERFGDDPRAWLAAGRTFGRNRAR